VAGFGVSAILIQLHEHRLNKRLMHMRILLESCIRNRSDRCVATPILFGLFSLPQFSQIPGTEGMQFHLL